MHDLSFKSFYVHIKLLLHIKNDNPLILALYDRFGYSFSLSWYLKIFILISNNKFFIIIQLFIL